MGIINFFDQMKTTKHGAEAYFYTPSEHSSASK
jgi:hypothetical protein